MLHVEHCALSGRNVRLGLRARQPVAVARAQVLQVVDVQLFVGAEQAEPARARAGVIENARVRAAVERGAEIQAVMETRRLALKAGVREGGIAEIAEFVVQLEVRGLEALAGIEAERISQLVATEGLAQEARGVLPGVLLLRAQAGVEKGKPPVPQGAVLAQPRHEAAILDVDVAAAE